MKRILNRTKEECHLVALKYTRIGKFRSENQAVYSCSRRSGWLKDITEHMYIPRRGESSKEECKTAAIKYLTRSDFLEKDGFLYRAAKKNKWLDEVCSHMIPKAITNRTKDDCLVIALKYSTRSEFFNGNRFIYYLCARNKWLEDACLHMNSPNKKSNVLYMWNVKDTAIWKIGISNENQVDDRIRKVSQRHNFIVGQKFVIIRDDARECETKLLEFCETISDIRKNDGFTEFRILTNEHVNIAKKFFTKEI